MMVQEMCPAPFLFYPLAGASGGGGRWWEEPVELGGSRKREVAPCFFSGGLTTNPLEQTLICLLSPQPNILNSNQTLRIKVFKKKRKKERTRVFWVFSLASTWQEFKGPGACHPLIHHQRWEEPPPKTGSPMHRWEVLIMSSLPKYVCQLGAFSFHVSFELHSHLWDKKKEQVSLTSFHG